MCGDEYDSNRFDSNMSEPFEPGLAVGEKASDVYIFHVGTW